ncbi:hypothetical protein GBF38_016612, partial [Nibea albiflora]
MTKTRTNGECPICGKVLQMVAKHLRETHLIKNGKERAILNSMATGRTVIPPGPCPIQGCSPAIINVDKHLKAHKELTYEQIAEERRKAKRAAAIKALATLRASSPDPLMQTRLDLADPDEAASEEERGGCIFLLRLRRAAMSPPPQKKAKTKHLEESEEVRRRAALPDLQTPKVKIRNLTAQVKRLKRQVADLKMHISIVPAGTTPKVECCTSCCNQFHCPLCLTFKPTKLSKLQTHLEAHRKGGILYKDKIICRCGLNCRDQRHFHCPVCNKTVVRRPDMARHLEACQGAMTATSTEQTSPPTNKDTAAASSFVLPAAENRDSRLSLKKEKHQDTGYPPPDDTLERLVKYLYSKKKIPADLPDDLIKPKALTNHLTELHPTETVCTNCPGSVHLQNSTRVTQKAKIISMNGILERPPPSGNSAEHQPLPGGIPPQTQGLHSDPKKDIGPCGTQCELLTKCDQVAPCRASWTVQNPAQEQLLEYILDIEKPKTELIVKTQKGCLTRADFWTLGLNNQMESTIGNACFQLIEQIAQSKNDVHMRDAIVIPIWKPGHFLLSADMPTLRKWWCVMLIENFDLGSHGKMFAHWTDMSKALLAGEVPPVFRLKKRKVDDMTE